MRGLFHGDYSLIRPRKSISLNMARRTGLEASLVILYLMTFGLASAAQAEYYPPRPVYDYNKYDPSAADCRDLNNPASDHGRCGPTDGPVFNSFVNTPSYGDERAFFDARRSDLTASGSYDNILQNVLDGSKLVIMRVYVNNDANEYFGHKTAAQGTRVRVALPAGAGSALRARAYVIADNASPHLVEDTVDLTDGREFIVEYVPGSAKIYSGDDQAMVSDDIVTRGALITNVGVEGLFAAGFERDAVVQFQVRVRAVRETTSLLIPIVAFFTVFTVSMSPTLRTRAGRALGWCWQWQDRNDIPIRVLTGLIVSGLIAVIIWAVGRLF